MKSKINEFKIEAENAKIKRGENIKLNISCNLIGEIRDSFIPENWELAYLAGDRRFMLRYFVKIKLLKGIFSKNILEDKIVRKAVFFFTRNPTIEKTYWVELVLEDKQPYLIKSLEEIKEKLFNLKKAYEINSSMLRIGNNKIRAEIRVKWANYAFIKSSTLKSKSNVIEIECLE